MAEVIKPPLGVTPHWMVNRKRIRELNSAIERCIERVGECVPGDDHSEMYLRIAIWAKELSTIALMESELVRMEEEHRREK